jgi:ribA/ribD-fused uncharacterized protein
MTSAPITSFRGDHRYLSNFYSSPITFDNQSWPTAEHLYQALKTTDAETRETIRQLSTPREAKLLGQIVALRPDWDNVKFTYMLQVVRLKFHRNPELRAKLLATGDAEIVEGNIWHDNLWGDCSCERCQYIPGLNRLGKILMQVRAELRQQEHREIREAQYQEQWELWRQETEEINRAKTYETYQQWRYEMFGY